MLPIEVFSLQQAATISWFMVMVVADHIGRTAASTTSSPLSQQKNSGATPYTPQTGRCLTAETQLERLQGSKVLQWRTEGCPYYLNACRGR